MATTYYSPGVYIEEVDKGPKPIQGVSTSITAFVGITEKAELVNEDGFTTRSLLSEAKLVTNWSQYEACFGSYHENAYLPYAVRGFFDNGGATAWVISIHALNAHPAQALLFANHPKDETKTGPASLLIHAKDAGPVGEKIKITVRRNGAATSSNSTSTTTGSTTGGTTTAGTTTAGTTGATGATATGAGPATTGTTTSSASTATGGALAEDEFILVVQKEGEAPQEERVKLDSLPFWGDQGREPRTAHDRFQRVKVWRLTKNGKLDERMPKAVATVQLLGGVPKFDLDLVKDDADRNLLRGVPTSQQEDDLLSRNAVQLFNGNATLRKGADGLEALDNLNLICAPDLVLLHKNKVLTDDQLIGLQKSLLSFCEKTLYRFAILDSPHNRKLPEDILKWRQHTANFDATHGHGALYYPWIKITDPLTGKTKEIPPCGHIAGIYARSDTQRGVHKAPANEQILGPVTDVTINVTKGEQDLLNPVGINCIRAFPGRGIRVWGARTLSSDPAWRYINVRRLFNYVEESVERSTQWVVFEPNDYFLWGRVRRDVTAFLRTVWMSGALFGASPDQAFYVKCDEELNPAEIRDQGIMICEIGLAPVKPAEFVVFRFSQYAIEAG